MAKSTLPRTKSMVIMAENNIDLLFTQFVIKIIDDGLGISKEGIKNLFVNFSSLKEH